MPTNYTDQFYNFDPASPPAAGTSVSWVSRTLTDQDDDGDIGSAGGDMIDGIDVTRSWDGDTVTINVPGVGNVTYTGITFYLDGGGRAFTPTDGQVLQNGTFVSSTFVTTQSPLDVGELGPPCFTRGTRIKTLDGPRRVEDLKVGNQVITLDNGYQPIRWIGSTTVAAQGVLAPIRFETGVLGLRKPLLVSPQHRIFVNDWRVEFYFGHREMLIPAHALVNGTTVTRVEGGEIEYFHILFDQHEIIFSNGIRTESYYPGHAVTRAERETQAEILQLFPGLNPRTVEAEILLARPQAKASEAHLLSL